MRVAAAADMILLPTMMSASFGHVECLKVTGEVPDTSIGV
jgi:hypothetical protein